ncbi:hypothetical protein [Mesorhizobium sp.]|uniref:hypothetical protein n=1 Tax=Mesorhizobium sp. TaxID=1871066 RepID=UPI0025D738A6|nr:hypothetical protein [Mesorhizobium sp.]
MRVILSALILALALPQVAEAKTKILLTDTKATKTEKKRPPLDETVLGGIPPDAKAQTSPPYPQALNLHF